jgi:hypothetical protein
MGDWLANAWESNSLLRLSVRLLVFSVYLVLIGQALSVAPAAQVLPSEDLGTWAGTLLFGIFAAWLCAWLSLGAANAVRQGAFHYNLPMRVGWPQLRHRRVRRLRRVP